MKFAFVAFAALCAGAFADDPKDAIQAQLSNMMAAANNNLALAEDHHKKAIEKGRDQLTFDFGDESRAAQQDIGEYAGALVKAWTDFSAAVNVSEAGLKKEEAKPISPGDWSGPGFAERAKLGAQIGAAERLLKKAERKRSRKVKEADETIETAMEDESQKLSWKLGDISSVTDDMKQGLESVVDEIETNFTKNITASKVEVVKAKKDDEQGRLVAFEGTLEAASKKFETDQDSAGKKVNTFLAKESTEYAAKGDAIGKDVDQAQHVELTKTFGDAPKLKAVAKKVKVALKAPDAKKASAATAKKA